MSSRTLPDAETAGAEPRLVAHFEAVAGRHPDRLAVVTDNGSLTYAGLNAAANQLAHLILKSGGAKGDRVAILLDDGPGLYATMLGVLKASRVVVVLDPKDPPDRLRQIASDAEPALLVTDGAHRADAGSIADSTRIVVLGDEASSASTNPELDIRPDETAFLVYTSGSTGRPKAVIKSHGHVLLQPLTAGHEMQVTAEDRILMLAALSGGQGVNTTWIALASGATLVTFPAAEKGVTGLARSIAENAITIFVSSAALFRTFMKTVEAATRFPGVRLATLAGDAATWRDFREFRDRFPNGRLVTAFAASETGYITLLTLDRDATPGEGPLPVGRPCAGREVRILDDRDRECPQGTVGSIEVRGPHLASGYWRDPELTARTFRRSAGGIQSFRSSDLGLIAADGSLVLKGRADAAIKIRGHRVDIAEVEKALGELPGVADAAAGAVVTPGGEPQLVGYVVASDRADTAERRLRTVARATMARHLIPSSFVFLDRLPTTANGKVDRALLREIAPAAERRPAEPPATPTEKLLAELWEAAFGLPGIGGSDDFFALGGDSLVAAEVAARLHAETGVRIDLGTFADAPVLRDMAGLVDRLAAAPKTDDDPPITPAPRDRPIPLSYHQQLMWPSSQSQRLVSRFNVASLIELSGPLDPDALRQALTYVVGRHESLRTRFVVTDGEPLQVIDPPADLPLPRVDLSSAADPDRDARRLRLSELNRDFDLAAAPPVRFTLVRLAPDRHALLRSSHHIISDAPSWNLLMGELAEAYASIAAGAEPDLPDPPVQYADYTLWQRDAWRRDGPRYRRTVAWWRDQLAAPGGGTPSRRLALMRSRPTRNVDLGEQSLAWGLDAETSRRLDELAIADAATYYAVRVATLLPILAALTGSDRVVIGAYFTRRHRPELERMFGLLVDTVPLVVSCDRSLTFRRFVDHVRRRIVETSAHADIPYRLLQEAMAEAKIPMPTDPFIVHMPTQTPAARFAGLELRIDDGERRSRRGVQFWYDHLREVDNGCRVFFDGRIYDPDAVNDLVSALVRFSETVARSPDVTIGEAIDGSRVDRDPPSAA